MKRGGDSRKQWGSSAFSQLGGTRRPAKEGYSCGGSPVIIRSREFGSVDEPGWSIWLVAGEFLRIVPRTSEKVTSGGAVLFQSPMRSQVQGDSVVGLGNPDECDFTSGTRDQHGG